MRGKGGGKRIVVSISVSQSVDGLRGKYSLIEDHAHSQKTKTEWGIIVEKYTHTHTHTRRT